jgi:hypothetical protein
MSLAKLAMALLSLLSMQRASCQVITTQVPWIYTTTMVDPSTFIHPGRLTRVPTTSKETLFQITTSTFECPLMGDRRLVCPFTTTLTAAYSTKEELTDVEIAQTATNITSITHTAVITTQKPETTTLSSSPVPIQNSPVAPSSAPPSAQQKQPLPPSLQPSLIASTGFLLSTALSTEAPDSAQPTRAGVLTLTSTAYTSECVCFIQACLGR